MLLIEVQGIDKLICLLCVCVCVFVFLFAGDKKIFCNHLRPSLF